MNTSSIIDLILTNSSYVHETGVLELNISDHNAIFVDRKKQKQDKPKIKFKGRSYRNYNRHLFQESLLNENWDLFFNMTDPNLCWDEMFEIISKCINSQWYRASLKKSVVEVQDKGWAVWCQPVEVGCRGSG